LLKNQVAVVTGASSGIGRAIAWALAGQGADVCLVARRRDVLEELATQIRGVGARCRSCSTDVTSDEDLRVLGGEVQREFGGVDVLVLCGGAIFHGKTEQASLENFDLQYRANLRAPYALIQLLLPSLRQKKGQIVFINSSAGTRSASESGGQFAATQHGLRAIADSLRDEVNSDGIRVLSVYPGRTATPRMEALYEERGLQYSPELLMQPQDVATMVIAALSLPRTAEVTDISMRPMSKSY
jgi:NADP-dependent 3-hydroxy acid dehydrogenase YdfG